MKLRTTLIRDIVYGFPVVFAHPAMSLRDAVNLLNKMDIGSLVVEKDDAVVGVFTERDIIRQVISEDVDLDQQTVGQFMKFEPVCYPLDTPLVKPMISMRLGNHRHIVITGDNGKAVGVLSIKDIGKHILDHCAGGCPALI